MKVRYRWTFPQINHIYIYKEREREREGLNTNTRNASTKKGSHARVICLFSSFQCGVILFLRASLFLIKEIPRLLGHRQQQEGNFSNWRSVFAVKYSCFVLREYSREIFIYRVREIRACD